MLCFVGLTLFPPLCIHVNADALEVVFEAKSGRRLARQLGTLTPQTQVACLECFPNGLLFYLRTRGIPLEEARALLIKSFVGEALDKLESEPVREALARMTNDRLAQLAASH